MHVREIPYAIFDELVDAPQTVGVHDFAARQYRPGTMMHREFAKRSDEVRITGETDENCWLWVSEQPGYTKLGVYQGLEAVMIDTGLHASVELGAGDRDAESYVTQHIGAISMEHVWLQVNHLSYLGSDMLDYAQRSLAVAAKIVELANEYSGDDSLLIFQRVINE